MLELFDPLQSTDVVLDGRHVPLESDITTPLAYSLNDKSFAKLDQPTTGLLYPDRIKKLTGIYMLEPYQPGKIPVLMVHGLWSSPITWMEMFNDLRGDPEIRGAIFNSGSICIPPVSRSGTRHAIREELAQLRQDGRSDRTTGIARSNGDGGPQHGRADCEHAGRQQPRRLLAHRQR